MAKADPRAPIPTFYNETYRGASYRYMEPHIESMANQVNMIGYLEHYDQSTDGSFGICFAAGTGNFISRTFYETIPEAHRPPLKEDDAGIPVSFLMSPTSEAIGSIMFPFLFTDNTTGRRSRMKLYNLVLPDLYLPVFIGTGTARSYMSRLEYRENGSAHRTFSFPSGETVTVDGY